jgi:hypothetical protein
MLVTRQRNTKYEIRGEAASERDSSGTTERMRACPKCAKVMERIARREGQSPEAARPNS